MSTKLLFSRDVQGYNAYAPYFPLDAYSATITSGSAESVTVPSNANIWIAVFSYQPGSDIWVSVNNTASNPAGGTFASTTSILLPAQLTVNAGNTISCYNNNATSQDVGISFYAIA